ncbi:hypothetical protein COCON_G00160790 [Conger conger]|uniref:Oxysterol-binding protein n=1 Tax=Conger conger TaxID=82655 RepID=A0A9Q1DA15_CONCO|nr:hypothetical protein COCON_G00160790 [Conger conger]
MEKLKDSTRNDSGDEEPTSQSDRSEIQGTLKTLASKLDDLSTCNDLIAKHGAALQRSLSELEALRLPLEGGEKIKAVNERATLFRITSNAMINVMRAGRSLNGEAGLSAACTSTPHWTWACRDFLDLAETHSRRWQRALQYEREQRIHLEETIEQLAKQHNSLERAWREAPALASNTPATPAAPATPAGRQGGSERPLKGEASDEDEDTEYFDAMEDSPAFITVTAADHTQHRRSVSNISGASGGHANDWNQDDHASPTCNDSSGKELRRRRRSHIPDKPNYSLNLWSIMKNCIGKELSKIPMPVNFNEPLSMLQRLTEDLEYSELLDRAARCESSLEQLCYVAAFSVSSYSTTVHRTAKPFNPLLGETYELDRLEEQGYRSLCEPLPRSATTPGRSAPCDIPAGLDAVAGDHHRQQVPREVPVNHASGCDPPAVPLQREPLRVAQGHLHRAQHHRGEAVDRPVGGHRHSQPQDQGDVSAQVLPYSYFSRDVPRKVTGVVTDGDRQAHYILSGTWDDKIESAKIVQSSRGGGGSEGKQKTVYQTLSPKLLWKKYPLPENAENMYCFSALALTLNEAEDGVGPTDSRLRPDQRLMEAGRWDEANVEKQRLEEKQRAVERQPGGGVEGWAVFLSLEPPRSGGEYEAYRPRWFQRRKDSLTGEAMFMYKGGYWEAKERQDWNSCPEIF